MDVSELPIGLGAVYAYRIGRSDQARVIQVRVMGTSDGQVELIDLSKPSRPMLKARTRKGFWVRVARAQVQIGSVDGDVAFEEGNPDG